MSHVCLQALWPCGLQSVAQRGRSCDNYVGVNESQFIVVVVDNHMAVNKKVLSVFYYCDVRSSSHGSKFHREIGKLCDGAICARDVCTTCHVF